MSILEEDFESIANTDLDFGKFQNCSFLVTGATGLVGTLFVKTLIYLNEKYNLNLHIIAMVRNEDKANKVYEQLKNSGRLSIIVQDMTIPFSNVEGKIDYIVHAASVTASKDMITYPVQVIQTAITGTTSILNIAKEKNIRGMVYISSMEVYGDVGDVKHRIRENELGDIDISLVRSGYPEGKRLCECLCNAYAKQYGVPVVSARLSQTFGAGILPGEKRVFAQFARSVINGTDIVLHTKGLSEGNYVYISDAVSALLLLLVRGKCGEAYNISNEESHTTIGGMAEMVVRKVSNNKIKVVYDIPDDLTKMGYAPDVKLFLSSEKMRRLGWKPKVGLEESYNRMIKYLKEMEESDR